MNESTNILTAEKPLAKVVPMVPMVPITVFDVNYYPARLIAGGLTLAGNSVCKKKSTAMPAGNLGPNARKLIAFCMPRR